MGVAEQELIRRSQAGDDGAHEEIFRRFVESVFATAYRLTGNRTDADDITQETFVRAFSAIGGFEGRSSFRTWLYRILLNAAHDHFRKSAKERARTYVRLTEAEMAPATGVGASPPDVASAREERELLRAVLWELPEKQRVAVTLVYLDGMSCKEAAQVMEAREGTVYYWLHEGRKLLARRLGRLLEAGGAPGESGL